MSRSLERRVPELGLGLGLAELVVSRLEALNHAQLLLVRVVRIGELDRDLDAAAIVGEARIRALDLGVPAGPVPFPSAPMKVGQRRGCAVIPRAFPLPPFPNPTCVFRYASGSPLVLVAKPGVFIQPNWKGCTRRRAM